MRMFSGLSDHERATVLADALPWLQHYRDTSVLPFIQIGHKCYYKREDVERLLEIKSVKSNTDKSKDNK